MGRKGGRKREGKERRNGEGRERGKESEKERGNIGERGGKIKGAGGEKEPKIEFARPMVIAATFVPLPTATHLPISIIKKTPKPRSTSCCN